MSLTKKIVFSAVGLFVLLLISFGITIPINFNKAVKMEEQIFNDYALISTALETRFEKMEALLGAIDGLEEHVSLQLSKITDARLRLGNHENLNDITNDIENSFNDIIVLIEDNPNIYIVTSTYNAYMAEITASINVVMTSKIIYNESVTTFNTFVKQFPRNMYMSAFGFKTKALYDPQLVS